MNLEESPKFDTIHQWIHVNEDFEVELDVDQVRAVDEAMEI